MKVVKSFALCGFVLIFILSGTLSAEEGQKVIPDKVMKMIEKYEAEKDTGQDIPFEISKTLYLPAQNYNFVVFIFKLKNKDVYSEPNKNLTNETDNDLMVSDLNLFVLVKNKKGEILEKYGSVYVPFHFEIEKSAYKPEQDNVYTVWNFIPDGDHQVYMSLTTKDLKKTGISDIKLSLPAPNVTGKLSTTSIFFVNDIKELVLPEQTRKVHKNYFVYSRRLSITPRLKPVFKQDEIPDLFFTILGCQPMPENPREFNIEVHYVLKKKGKKIMQTEKQILKSPLVSQPIPLQTKEHKYVNPGEYVLEIYIKDLAGGKKLKESVKLYVR